MNTIDKETVLHHEMLQVGADILEKSKSIAQLQAEKAELYTRYNALFDKLVKLYKK